MRTAKLARGVNINSCAAGRHTWDRGDVPAPARVPVANRHILAAFPHRRDPAFALYLMAVT
jgi:hypothetical protein